MQCWTDIRPISDTAEIRCYGLTPPLCFKHSNCKPGRFMQRGNLSIIRAISHGKMTDPFEILWSILFLTACLTFLVTVTSLQCVFCVVLKDCWRADVSTANEDWLVGQLLPYHVTSSRSYLCCSVRCSIIQALPTPRRLGSFWFCFKRTGIGK